MEGFDSLGRVTSSTAAAVPPARPLGQRWGLSDVAGWYLLVILLQTVVLAILRSSEGGVIPDPTPVWMLFVVQIPQWVCYGIGPLISTSRRGDGPIADLGLRLTRSDLTIGLVTGLVAQLLIIPLLYFPITRIIDSDPGEAARELIDLIDGPADIIMMAIVVVVMAPLVEELFYRGLLQGALRRYFADRAGPRMFGSLSAADTASIAISGLLFALLHFQPLQFAGLFVFGLILGWLRVRYDRLGPAWAAHLAFNAVTFGVLVAG